MTNYTILDESKRQNHNQLVAGASLGAGATALGLLNTTPVKAQTASPVLDINTEVDNLETLTGNAIPIAISVIAFMIGALIVGRVMRA